MRSNPKRSFTHDFGRLLSFQEFIMFWEPGIVVMNSVAVVASSMLVKCLGHSQQDSFKVGHLRISMVSEAWQDGGRCIATKLRFVAEHRL